MTKNWKRKYERRKEKEKKKKKKIRKKRKKRKEKEAQNTIRKLFLQPSRKKLGIRLRLRR